MTLRSCQKRENLVINLVRPELCLVPFSIDVTAKHGFNGIRKKQTRGLYRAIQQSRLRHSPLRCQKSLPVIIYRYVNVARSTASINYTGYTTGFEGAETTANRHQSNVTRPSWSWSKIRRSSTLSFRNFNDVIVTVFIQHVYGSLWRWKHWSVRQIKPAQLAFGRTLI